MYYGHRFTDKDDFTGAISYYIDYYNNRRLQRKLAVMTPMAYHNKYTLAA
jgi:transposase InsO family protein